ncbi:MAG: hypothetical protein JW990_05310 [Thermoleophilia bacterium]|nr:hypothetical protein [Thermoleophilia bacterium]
MRRITRLRPLLVGPLCWCALLPPIAGAGDPPSPAVPIAPGAAAAPASAGTEAYPHSLDEVIARYSQACGGPALAQVATERRSGTIVRGQFGKMPVETVARIPDRWHYHQVFSYGDQVSFGCDGNDAWIQDNRSVESMDAQQRVDLQLLLDPQAPLKIRGLFPDLELLGAESVGDREGVTIQARTAAGVATVLVFDRETGLLLRAGGMRFEDYREVNGVMRPFLVILGESDEEAHLQMRIEFTSTDHNVAVDEAIFHRPKQSLPVTEAPLYKDYRETEVSLEALDACVGAYQHPSQAGVTYTVTRWQNHLMLHRTGWPTQREIIPASETEYFIRFPGTDFRFVRDAAGRVTHLDIANGAVTAAKIE